MSCRVFLVTNHQQWRYDEQILIPKIWLVKWKLKQKNLRLLDQNEFGNRADGHVTFGSKRAKGDVRFNRLGKR